MELGASIRAGRTGGFSWSGIKSVDYMIMYQTVLIAPVTMSLLTAVFYCLYHCALYRSFGGNITVEMDLKNRYPEIISHNKSAVNYLVT